MIRNFACFCILSIFITRINQVVAQPVTDSFNSYNQSIPGTEIKFKMMPVKGGSFIMGSDAKEKGRKSDEGPAKEISVSSFWMGAYEVTYDEYDAFFKDEAFTRNQPVADAITRPSPPYIDLTLGMGKQGGFPANSMSQYGALMFCRWLYKKTGVFYRLPTEAEWEYACRAGSKTAYPFGNDTTGLSKYAWYKNNSDNKYHKTGLKSPNKLGLYDILGNVSEWALDQYDENYFQRHETASKDPLIVRTARHPRTLKGGNYQDAAPELRSASRLKSNLDWNKRDPQIPRSRWWNADAPFIGFRIVRPAIKPSEEEINKFFALYLDNY
ncbi:formylglycine-generating enzyme family protein [Segetibacter koreensis]|uniref:formylglycine-generating enzyme family protein n=1 Tax=Segetibacter koreensis TaxID=398037 RepID=UPI00036E6060|nr:SUMF1/EgtB/PvdO family nonheme iron enzyme [Segetibacter koreensis]